MSSGDLFIQSRYYQVLLWVVAAICIVLGIYLTRISFMNTEWLSRSGCAIVMLGIWSGLGVIVQERLILGRLRWRRRNALTKAQAECEATEPDSPELEKVLQEINEAFENEASKLTQKLKMSLGVLEVSLLITGTFLWGFGDLLIG